MKYYFKFIEYAYLIIAVFFIEETIRTWGDSQSQTFLFGALGLMAIFMFFFKRWFRKKTERENSNR